MVGLWSPLPESLKRIVLSRQKKKKNDYLDIFEYKIKIDPSKNDKLKKKESIFKKEKEK